MQYDVLILDGRHLLYRTADAFRTLCYEDKKGTHAIGGVYGFLLTASKVQKRWGGLAVVCWEGSKNFRYDIYPQYKHHKTDIDEETAIFLDEMAQQEIKLKVLLSLLGVKQIYGTRCEADDAIGTIAVSMAKRGRKVAIYSGDSDLRQLVDKEHIRAISPVRKSNDAVYDSKAVFEKHGVWPDQIADFKALAGDNSDGIPGIRGVGPKTAAKLLVAYDTLVGVLLAAHENRDDWPSAERLRNAVLEGAEILPLYLKLTTIKTDVKLTSIKPKRDIDKFVKMLKKYKFRSFLTPMGMSELRRLANEK